MTAITLQSNQLYDRALVLRDEVSTEVKKAAEKFKAKIISSDNPNVAIARLTNASFNNFIVKMNQSFAPDLDKSVTDAFINSIKPYFFAPTLLQKEIEEIVYH